MQVSEALDRLSLATVATVDACRERFVQAKPFKHICIEDFLERALAERLLNEFPTFDRKKAIAEGGNVGGKAVNTAIGEISPAYAELREFISSAAFLQFMSELSGIPDLQMEPRMHGGGTHENLRGQDLDPHIDFNIDVPTKLHRRLNLIVYLNKEWKTEWGGGIEIHSNPRRPETNQITTFDPLFNRAVMFETNEVSWHGFSRIEFPEEKRHLSRKSISIYLYTKDRPAEEMAPVHTTFYVQRPLPEKFGEGYQLTAEDVLDLRRFLIRRDQWIELYQKMELDLNRSIEESEARQRLLESQARLPLSGYILQAGSATGYFSDGWASPSLEVKIKPSLPVSDLTLVGYRPDEAGPGRIRMILDGDTVGELENAAGKFEVCAKVSDLREPFTVRMDFETSALWKHEHDPRDLAFMLLELRAGHSVAADKRSGGILGMIDRGLRAVSKPSAKP